MEKSVEIIRMQEPVNCHLWQKAGLVSGDFDFESVETYYESSHFDRKLLRCKRCGQLYYYEYYEIVNFAGGGDDQQYCTYIPVRTKEEIEMLNGMNSFELLMVIPRLQFDDCVKWMR